MPPSSLFLIMVKEEVCAGVIPLRIQPDKSWEMLLICHVKGNYWAFPKGHSHPGENPYTTAERELFEETNLKIERLYGVAPLKEDYFFERDQENIHKQVTYYPALVKGDLQLKELGEVHQFKWLPIQEVLEQITFSGTRKMLEPLLQSLNTPPKS